MKKFVIGCVYIILVSIVLVLLSSNAQPGSSLFSIKRLQEKITLYSKADPQEKATYYAYLLEVRMKELENMVTSGSTVQILPTSLRYAATAGEYTMHVKANNLTKERESLINQFDRHEKILNRLVITYKPKTYTDDTAKFITDALNYLKNNKEQLTH